MGGVKWGGVGWGVVRIFVVYSMAMIMLCFF